MRLLKSRLVEAYQQMKLRARADGSPILICVASDCDAISANHIFTVNAFPGECISGEGGLWTPAVPTPLAACALLLVQGGPWAECST